MKTIILKICLLTLLLSSSLSSLANNQYASQNNEQNKNFFVADSVTDLNNSCSQEITSSEKNRKLLTVNLAGIGIITAWGIAQWDYYTESPKTTSEGWFDTAPNLAVQISSDIVTPVM